MKRKSTVYGLLGAIGLVVGLSAINPAVSDKSKKNDKIAVSVVSYDKAKKSDNLRSFIRFPICSPRGGKTNVAK